LRAQLGKQIRLVAVTGYGQESDRTRALEAGFDHHVVKPIAFDVLTSLLDEAPGRASRDQNEKPNVTSG
jgi:CheY-like chemotaxis protein